VTDPDAFRLLQRLETADGHDATAARDRLAAREAPKALHDPEEAARHFQLSPALETAINMALAVESPLLLTGEPGTGKTQVAWYLGWYFSIPVFDYQVRSNSTAEDLKYDFDAVAYLRTAQPGSAGGPEADGDGDGDGSRERHREDFLRPKALWRAYACETDSVLLIDEIDKAPRDFPNDLLHELEVHRFRHPFRKQDIKPVTGRAPIVVVTSNAERRLPDAFLRRTISHHIELTEELVRAAVRARAGDFPRLDEPTRQEAVHRFWEVRERENLRKKPSTAELLVWLAILSARGTRADQLRVPLADVPALAALVKDREDLEQL